MAHLDPAAAPGKDYHEEVYLFGEDLRQQIALEKDQIRKKVLSALELGC